MESATRPARYRRSVSYPGWPKCAPPASYDCSLIELNPFGRWTVKVATKSTDDHRRRGQGHEGAQEDQQPSQNLDQDRGPPEQMCERHTDRMQDPNESAWSAHELGVAVFHK